MSVLPRRFGPERPQEPEQARGQANQRKQVGAPYQAARPCGEPPLRGHQEREGHHDAEPGERPRISAPPDRAEQDPGHLHGRTFRRRTTSRGGGTTRTPAPCSTPPIAAPIRAPSTRPIGIRKITQNSRYGMIGVKTRSVTSQE